MGFWETAGKIAKGAANALDEKAHELQATKMRLEGSVWRSEIFVR